MSNLLEDVKRVLEENGKTIDDIVWFGTSDVKFEFGLKRLDSLSIYKSIEYLESLLFVGSDFWLEYDEYQAKWIFKSKPKMPEQRLFIKDERVITEDLLEAYIFAAGCIDYEKMRDYK